MLLPSSRHWPTDQEAWDNVARYDQGLAKGLPPLEDRALTTIRDFAQRGDCYASTSWGKDSTVLVDLIGRTGIDIPLISLVIDGYELPGTTEVRDIMLARYPHLRYDELTLPPQPNRWWSDATTAQSKHKADLGWRMIADKYGARRMTGIRAEESRIRTIVQQRWGDASPNTARPIGTWKATDVFAYLHHHRLPVHPAYGMSYGGKLDRRWIRVHALGGVSGSDKGRSDWETTYFGDVIDQSIARDSIMSSLGKGRAHASATSSIAAQIGKPIATTQSALMWMKKAGLVQSVTYQGRERWHRAVEWPPQPQWLREEANEAASDVPLDF